jgi:tRNA A-37 threonylcarbamoyl transferase component Bud32/tetratricopeptide (TPR) repeat protein
MTSARIARMEALFEAALRRPADERAEFLAAEESDPELRAAVERLLAHHTGNDGRLRDVLHAAIGQSAPPVRERVGAYRIVRELGAGGMGTVYLAERSLGETRQNVALKLIRDFPSAPARERLARESRLLAELNHPNIARLLDAGESDDRVPYLAMEYVEGSGLHDFCDAHALDVRARLALFVQICRAVQHAHQHLIVHRDIKPANILVRDDGTPVLLDFGIGKLIDDSARDATATHVFTPTYAAPEQIAGRAVTTATDIYGLGCVLHELLSGSALHDVTENGRTPPPSAAAADPSRARALRGELDTLVGKAMHEEPQRRYASAQALSDDVENWLAGRPLNAAPDSVAYRTRKFVARHRYAVLAAAIAAVVLCAFVWRLNAETARALTAEAHAEREVQSTRRSRDFLVSLFEAASPDNTLGHALSARELIDKGSEHVGQELKDEPETAARLDSTIAGVYAALGDPKAAVTSGERALALVKPDTPERALLRAEILLTLEAPYDNSERFDDAKRASAEALALRMRYAPDDHEKVGTALTENATAAVRRHDNAAARAFFDRALAEYAKAAHVEPIERAEVLRGLADLDNEEGRATESVQHAEAALAALAPLPAESPDRIETMRMLANGKLAAGDAAAAIAMLEETLRIARAALGDNSMKVADVENDLAVALNGEDRYREAIPHLEKAIAITEQVRPGDVAAAAFETINLGSIYESLGDYEKSEALMRKGIGAMDSATPDDPHIDFFRGNLARTLMLRGDLDGARALLDRTMRATAAREGEKSFDYAFAQFRLARVDLISGKLDAAAAGLDASIATLDPLLPPEHSLRAQFNVLRGMIAQAHGDLDAAVNAFADAEAHVSKVPLEVALVRMRLAGALLARGDLAAARAKLDAAMPPIEAALLPGAIERIETERVASELDRRDTLAGH